MEGSFRVSRDGSGFLVKRRFPDGQPEGMFDVDSLMGCERV